ncbi:unnamed protein product [Heligmosomoides polygyrus]|uniref:DUF5060 domain-containing protein n=1 Tax=Heligmosomoides polygyrus TaxID=6339 RepID=A0A183G005_HELPZ|nr:unnamed protein product [Heligmosomoides polygyrus]
MRALLQRPDISASYLGNGYVQVRRCIELPPTSVRLLPFNGTCYDAARVELRLPSGSTWHAFLTPATGIVRSHATVTDCSESGTFMFPSVDGVQQFSPHDGSWSTVATRDIRYVSSFPREVADDHGLREMWTALDHKQLMDHFARVDTSSHGSFGSLPSTGHQFEFRASSSSKTRGVVAWTNPSKTKWAGYVMRFATPAGQEPSPTGFRGMSKNTRTPTNA